ncbi:hypothetical protein [Eubacterium ramulus]|uniref:hypothetical protein n=1 Tax=Eubacterium ramulus TaxID=39490 RepID=UPI003999E805
MDREELMRELEDMFRDEPDNNKLNAVLTLRMRMQNMNTRKEKSLKKYSGEKMCVLRQERV